MLARLVEKSLLNAERIGRGRRYHLLETVRLYALEQLEQAGERAELAARHARWALATVEREGGSPGLDREAREPAGRTRHPARAATRARRFATRVALLPFWMRRIDLSEGHRRLEQSLAAAPERTATARRRAARDVGDRLPRRRAGLRCHARPGEPRDRRRARRRRALSGERCSGSARSRSATTTPRRPRRCSRSAQGAGAPRAARGV